MFKEKLKSIRKNLLLTSILTILSGILLIVYPGYTMSILCMIFGILCAVYGMVRIVAWIAKTRVLGNADLIMGLIVFAAGVLLMAHPGFMVSIIPSVVGFIILAIGINKLKDAIDIRNSGYSKWGSLLIPAILVLGLGLLIILNPFATAELTVRVIGATLAFNGVSDIWTITRVNKTIKNVHSYSDVIDTTGTEK